MEREFLKGLGLADDVIEKIMTQHGKSITAAKKAEADAQKQSISAKDTEIEGLKKQITDRDADVQKLKDAAKDYTDIQTQLTTLQGKYDADTKELNKKLTEQAAEFAAQTATDKFFSGVKFSSALAKEAAIAQFRAKKLKLENGTFVGGKEWLDELRKSSPDAFVSEDSEQQPPKYGGSLRGGQQGGQQNKNTFGFNFTPQRSAGLPNNGNK